MNFRLDQDMKIAGNVIKRGSVISITAPKAAIKRISADVLEGVGNVTRVPFRKGFKEDTDDLELNVKDNKGGRGMGRGKGLGKRASTVPVIAAEEFKVMTKDLSKKKDNFVHKTDDISDELTQEKRVASTKTAQEKSYDIGFTFRADADLVSELTQDEFTELPFKAQRELGKLFNTSVQHMNYDTDGAGTWSWDGEFTYFIEDLQKVADIIAKNDTTINDGIISLDCGVDVSNFVIVNGKWGLVEYADWDEQFLSDSGVEASTARQASITKIALRKRQAYRDILKSVEEALSDSGKSVQDIDRVVNNLDKTLKPLFS